MIINPISSVAGNGSNIYVSTNKKISISNDNGLHWITHQYIANKIIVNGSTVYGATNNGLIISHDNGLTWVNRIIPNVPSIDNYMTGIIVNGSSIYIAGRGRIIKTTDEGLSWSTQALPSYSDLISFEGEGSLFCASGSGLPFIVSTDNGVTWTNRTPVNNGITGSVSGIAVSGSSIYVAQGINGVSKSTDNGLTWTPVVSTNLMGTWSWYSSINGIKVKGNNIYLSTNAGLVTSTDSGLTWNVNTRVGSSWGGFYRVINLWLDGNSTYVLTDVGLYKNLF
jgi:hypothetical protein